MFSAWLSLRYRLVKSQDCAVPELAFKFSLGLVLRFFSAFFAEIRRADSACVYHYSSLSN